MVNYQEQHIDQLFHVFSSYHSAMSYGNECPITINKFPIRNAIPSTTHRWTTSYVVSSYRVPCHLPSNAMSYGTECLIMINKFPWCHTDHDTSTNNLICRIEQSVRSWSKSFHMVSYWAWHIDEQLHMYSHKYQVPCHVPYQARCVDQLNNTCHLCNSWYWWTILFFKKLIENIVK